MRRIDFYRINRGDNLGDPEFWNIRLEDVDLRVGRVEDQLQDLDAIANRVEAAALTRINEVVTPLVIEAQTRLASIPSLFSATSVSTASVGFGTKSFVIDDLARDTWAVSTFLYCEATEAPGTWMLGNLISFDRQTGALQVDILDYEGSGSHSEWLFTVSGRRGPQGETGDVGMTYRGAFSLVEEYAPRDVVRYDRSSWICVAATTGIFPPTLPKTSNAFWQLLVERGADGQETGAFETEFSETVTVSPKATFMISGGYSPEASMMVFHNGVKLAEEDYTADDGETLVLDTPAEVGDIVEFKAFSVFGIGAVLQVGLNLADLDDPDTALVNLGGSTVGRDVFKAASQTAGRSALGAAASSHQHPVSDVTGLQTALDGKSALGHTHAIADVVNLQTALDGKAASSHSHSIGQISGLQAALDGKAASGHTHGATYIINGWGGHYVYIGWDGSAPQLKVDSTYQGQLVHTGNFLSLFAMRRVYAGSGRSVPDGAFLTSISGSTVSGYYIQYYWNGTWYGIGG